MKPLPSLLDLDKLILCTNCIGLTGETTRKEPAGPPPIKVNDGDCKAPERSLEQTRPDLERKGNDRREAELEHII